MHFRDIISLQKF